MIPGRGISVDAEKCSNCHICISVCPVKKCIDSSGGSIKIIDECCLVCGRCVRVCKQKACSYFDDTERFLRDAGTVPIALLIDPSAVSVFPNLENLNGYLGSLGAGPIFDIAFGAELTARSIIKYGEKNNPRLLINSACPAIVNYCEIYRPALLPYLAPVQTPAHHTAIMIREFFPECAEHKLAVISSCAAKKQEFDEAGYIDYSITLSSLKEHIKKNQIDLSTFEPVSFTGPEAERGVAFFMPGGMHSMLRRELPEFHSARKIHGSTVYSYLNSISAALETDCAPAFVDCLDCMNGCSRGAGAPNTKIPLDIVEYPVLSRVHTHIEKYRNTINEQVDSYWKEEIYTRTFTDKSAVLKNIEFKAENTDSETDRKRKAMEMTTLAAETTPIQGINYSVALIRFGTEEVYTSIVKSYVKTTPDLLEKIKTVSRENIDDYMVTIHSIKGSSRAIGAESLGLKAEELERAAKQKRIGFCRAGNLIFREEAAKLIEALGEYIAGRAEKINKPEKDTFDSALLLKLKTACAEYDMAEIDSVMEELEAFSYIQGNDIIESIREHLDNSDLSSVAALL